MHFLTVLEAGNSRSRSQAGWVPSEVPAQLADGCLLVSSQATLLQMCLPGVSRVLRFPLFMRTRVKLN